MTRRVVKPQPQWRYPGNNSRGVVFSTVRGRLYGTAGFGLAQESWCVPVCPYGVPGDLLWVRETWSYVTLAQNERQPGDKWDPQLNMPVRMLYKADADAEGWAIAAAWSPSIFMPRWASRLTLRIESVRVERLQEITSDDIAAEGLDIGDYGSFAALWDKLNAKRGYGWETNPWVWVISFARVE
jgi:hypothetical protein